jgi:hypothetical protein
MSSFSVIYTLPLLSIFQALRLKARQLLTKRDTLREDAVKDQVEGEEQQVNQLEAIHSGGASIFHAQPTIF